jgi:hypothetical protein
MNIKECSLLRSLFNREKMDQERAKKREYAGSSVSETASVTSVSAPHHVKDSNEPKTSNKKASGDASHQHNRRQTRSFTGDHK